MRYPFLTPDLRFAPEDVIQARIVQIRSSHVRDTNVSVRKDRRSTAVRDQYDLRHVVGWEPYDLRYSNCCSSAYILCFLG